MFLTLTLITIIFSLTALSQKSANLPDFTITSEDINVELSGEDLTITATINNEGSAYEKFIDVLILVGNISFDERIKGLKAKEKKQVKVGPIAIGETIPEDLKVKVTIDQDNEIVESDERNNVGEKSVRKVVEKTEPDEEIETEYEKELPPRTLTKEEGILIQGKIKKIIELTKVKSSGRDISAKSEEEIEVGQGAPNETIKTAIINCYNNNNGVNILGEPITEVTDLVVVCIQCFEKYDAVNGYNLYRVIMVKRDGTEDNTKAYIVKSNILNKYYKIWEFIGAPKGNQAKPYKSPSPFNTEGYYQNFEGGSIQYSKYGCYYIKGAIGAKYSSLKPGWAKSYLGWPQSDEIDIKDKRNNLCGRYQIFEGGRIYWTNGEEKAYIIKGEILKKFLQLGNPIEGKVAIGLPITDVYPYLLKSTWGSKGTIQSFSNRVKLKGGKICNYKDKNNKNNTYVVYGEIESKWSEIIQGMAPDLGFLGFPKSDEYGSKVGRRSDFEGGYIYYSILGGAKIYVYQTSDEKNGIDNKKEAILLNDSDSLVKIKNTIKLSYATDSALELFLLKDKGGISYLQIANNLLAVADIIDNLKKRKYNEAEKIAKKFIAKKLLKVIGFESISQSWTLIDAGVLLYKILADKFINDDLFQISSDIYFESMKRYGDEKFVLYDSKCGMYIQCGNDKRTGIHPIHCMDGADGICFGWCGICTEDEIKEWKDKAIKLGRHKWDLYLLENKFKEEVKKFQSM